MSVEAVHLALLFTLCFLGFRVFSLHDAVAKYTEKHTNDTAIQRSMYNEETMHNAIEHDYIRSIFARDYCTRINIGRAPNK